MVADGLVTEDERQRLDNLARVLQIGPERIAVIEAAAKSERFRAAIVEVLADGVVAEDEARRLESLRGSLGISESDWLAGERMIQDATSGT